MLLRLLIRCYLVALAWLILPTLSAPAPLVYGPKREASAAQLWNCSMVYPKGMDAPHILTQLYGGAMIQEVNGTGSMLVLGNHNSGTSMVARLLMLMGAFQGQLNGLSTSPNNRLKYWERIDVSHFHDMLLRAVSDHRFRPYHAQNVNLGKLTPSMKRSLRCFAGRVIADSNRHKPWVLKDPRMLLFTEVWLNKMPDPVCIYIYRDPVANAMSLTENAKKSAESSTSAPMTATRWLKTWEDGTLHALSACEGYPTLILRLEEMQSDLNRFMFKLYAMLHTAGVAGLQIPARRALSAHFGDFVNTNATRRSRVLEQAPELSQSQTALVQALQLVRSTPQYGLARSPMRASAVMDMYRDTMRTWAMRNAAPDKHTFG